MNDYVNKQNCQIWSAEFSSDSWFTASTTNYCFAQILDWRSDWVKFFENAAGNARTSNGVRYHNVRLNLTDGYGRLVVPGKRRNLSHNALYTECQQELTTKIGRYDVVPLRSLGFCEITRLSQQTNNNSWAGGRDSASTKLSHNYAKILYFIKRTRVCQQSRGGHLKDVVFYA